MCIIIFIYVLFSDKRFPMPCHTLSIQVCRSTCFVKCKHARLKVQILQFAQNTLRKKKEKKKSIETCCSQEKNTTTLKHLLHKKLCASRLWAKGFLNIYQSWPWRILWPQSLLIHLFDRSQHRPYTSVSKPGAWGETAGYSDWVNAAVWTILCCESRLTWLP